MRWFLCAAGLVAFWMASGHGSTTGASTLAVASSRARTPTVSFSTILPKQASSEPGEEIRSQIKAYVQTLDLETLVGQTLMIGYGDRRGHEQAKKSLNELVKKYKVGGVILFKRNFPPQHDVSDLEIAQFATRLVESLQDSAAEDKPAEQRIPLLVAIDQESGGQVRLTENATRIPYAIHIGATRSAPLAHAAGLIVGREMHALGINTVLAPIADVNNNNENDMIGKRAFGAHKDLVAPLSQAFMLGLREGGVLSVGKHFPGHGTAKDDPHFVLPRLGYSDRAELEQNDLVPFKGLIEGNVDGIMTAHIAADVIDPNFPITISEAGVEGLLRKELGFKGVIFTDELTSMMGIRQNQRGEVVRSLTEVARRAYTAGNDVLIFGNLTREEHEEFPERTVTLAEFKQIHADILEFFQDRTLRHRLEQSVERILLAKATAIAPWPRLHERAGWTPRFVKSEYEDLLQKNLEVAKQIARESVVLMSEDGHIINDVSKAKYFGAGKGPLSSQVLLLSEEDTVAVATPVFTPPDDFSGVIGADWIPKSRLLVTRMVYGWRSAQAVDLAEERWGEDVEVFERIDSSGKRVFNEKAIEQKAKEIIERARTSRVLVFGVVTHGQVRILETVCEAYREDHEKRIVVLVFLEPYFIPGRLLKQTNTVFLSAPSHPNMEAAGDALFGRIVPKPISYLPVSIPGEVDRKAILGQQIKPLKPIKIKRGDGWPWAIFLEPFALTLYGGLAGGLLFFLVPRGRLRWKPEAPQYNKTDLLWSLVVGVVVAALTYFFLPLLEGLQLGPVKIGSLGTVPKFMAALLVTIVAQAGWLSYSAPRPQP